MDLGGARDGMVRRFGSFELDTLAGELRQHGRALHLAPQPMRLLELLASRPGELVERAEICAVLWPGRIVEFDQSLNFAMRKLRAALGDNADAPRYVATVPGRGYRFVASVQESVSADSRGPGVVAHALRPVAHTWRRGLRSVAAATVVLVVGVGGAWLVGSLADTASPVTVVLDPEISSSAPGMSAGFAAALRSGLDRLPAVTVVDAATGSEDAPEAAIGPLTIFSAMRLDGERLQLRLSMRAAGERLPFWESLHEGTPDQLPQLGESIVAELGEVLGEYRRMASAPPGTRIEETTTVREEAPPTSPERQRGFSDAE